MAVTGADTQAKDRGNVDDAATAPSLDQPLPGDLGDTPNAIEVGRQHGAPLLLTDFQRTLAAADAGVIEYHVDHTKVRLGRVKSRFHTAPVGDVEGHRHNLTIFPLYVHGKFL
ncbi:hypothetical protein D9M68_881140 [compost metagenome]